MTYPTAPLDKDIEITGPNAATLWAVTDGKDTERWRQAFDSAMLIVAAPL